MIENDSAIHAPETDWADLLQARALSTPAIHDRDALLEKYRRHDEFYRERIGPVSTWAQVPPLEKHELQNIRVDPSITLREVRTSGTTGFQVTIHSNRLEREFRRALLYRPQAFYDLPQAVTQVVFVDGNWCADARMDPKEFIYGGRHYRTWFAGASGDPATIRTLLASLRPQLIRGISSGIVRFIEESRTPLHDLGVKIIGPGGESLPNEWRVLMREAFGAQVLDRYGSTETGAIAWQCPYCDRYHANTDEILLEENPQGLIATPLFSSSQPLLRYRLGDIVAFEKDSSNCRVRLPTMTIEKARRDDWVITGAGKKVSPLSFQFEQVPHLKAWRLHQLGDGSLDLYFESEQPEKTERLLLKYLVEVIPDQACRVTPGIWKLNRPGKFKRVSSDLASALRITNTRTR
jgi:phenylacetate-coenzyme A ligase PaaK-like adenylate-forming protein